MKKFSRRRMLGALPASIVWPHVLRGASAPLNLETVRAGRGAVVLSSGSEADPTRIVLERTWQRGLCRSKITNRGQSAAAIREVALFRLKLAIPAQSQLYGEGFQMLSQTGGTWGAPADIGGYTDRKHYRIPQPEDARVVYSLLTLSDAGQTALMAFTSSRRFAGKFYLRPSGIEVVQETEGLTLAPGESWELEEFLFAAGAERDGLLGSLAAHLQRNHPRLAFPRAPEGWCSWYCFGPKVTAEQVLENLDFIARHVPALKYVQIDDGYQPAMGDWLETGAAFGGGIREVLREIRKRGFQPAIWVAPFIAEEKSHVFRQHPDWFIRGADGAPLASNRVTFGGWRHGPWYALDGTHPGARKHLEELFRVMREEWGCTYFKLDANFWGAMHGGIFRDPKASRIEAYRRGMQAVLRGTKDAFVLGCNHPVWASMGLIHGSRSSGDISREWQTFSSVARENLHRAWQNGKLWWNDPDAVVLMGKLPEEEFRFHATATFATGGMMLSGDDLTKIDAARLAMLRKLIPPTGIPAVFEDPGFTAGRMETPAHDLLIALNWDDTPRDFQFRLARARHVSEFWTGEDLGKRQGTLRATLPPHSGRVYLCE
jgi:alpha-galactosidase